MCAKLAYINPHIQRRIHFKILFLNGFKPFITFFLFIMNFLVLSYPTFPNKKEREVTTQRIVFF